MCQQQVDCLCEYKGHLTSVNIICEPAGLLEHQPLYFLHTGEFVCTNLEIPICVNETQKVGAS